jgi:hypothetical protein
VAKTKTKQRKCKAKVTGIPKCDWFQPKATTSLEDARVLLEDVQTYLRHREAGLSPLVDITELLTAVETRLKMAIELENDHEELQGAFDDLEKQAKDEERIAKALRAKLTLWAQSGEKLSDQTLDHLAEAVSDFVITGEIKKRG